MYIKPKISNDELFRNILNMMEDSISFIPKSQVGARIAAKAQNLIAMGDYDSMAYIDMPYLITTQNQRYLDKVMPEMAKSACVILGAGDTVFELALKGYQNITALESNDLQILVFKLRRAALKTLPFNDFKRFLLDSQNTSFMASNCYKTVKEALKDDEEALFAWDMILHNPVQDLKDNFFKADSPNLESTQKMLAYMQNKPSYYALREAMEKINLTIHNGDAIEYLFTHPQEKFDYLDITNILLFIYQLACKNNVSRFKEVIKKLRVIYEQNVNPGGILVLDYLFSTDTSDFNKSEIGREGMRNIRDISTTQIYATTYDLLNELFTLEQIEIKPFIEASSLHGDKTGNSFDLNDTVLYSRKK